MNLCLHHFFILTEVEAPAAAKLLSLGLQESFGRVHQGQGTANRRFEFNNGMLELLWVHDSQEALSGPGAMLRFAERTSQLKDGASPFGIILCPLDGNDGGLPFNGWKYQPDYFTPPMAFHVGENSELLTEPLCIYAPFFKASDNSDEIKSPLNNGFANISHVNLSVACYALSDQLLAANTAHGLQIEASDEHLMELTFDHCRQGLREDFRPDLPLIIHW